MLTETAKVHAAAWKEMFDTFLKARAGEGDEPFVAFDALVDYDTYVDGKPRSDGTRSFLESRHIDLPEGSPDYPPDAETVNGLGNAKNELVLAKIKDNGVEAYAGSVRYVMAVRAVKGVSLRLHDLVRTRGAQSWTSLGWIAALGVF